MSSLKKGLLLAAIQVAIVGSLWAKLQWDRARLPRAWVPTRRYDPNLPIRGRYLSLQLLARTDSTLPPPGPRPSVNSPIPLSCDAFGKLYTKDGQLWAKLDTSHFPGTGSPYNFCTTPRGDELQLSTPVLFFLPEHATDPSTLGRDYQVWAEVTVPNNGPPRPIRLAIKHGDTFTPLETK